MDNLLQLDIELYKDGNYTFLGLTDKQEEALTILQDNEIDVLLFGGAAGGGKTWLGCTWLLFNCIAYPDTRWFMGREELKRIKSTTLRTFYKVCREYKIRPDEDFKYNGQENYILFNNGSRIDLLDLKELPSDPFFERLGSEEFTGGFIEEAGEIEFNAFDTLKSRVGRQMNQEYNLRGNILLTANPKKSWLYYEIYKPSKTGTLQINYRFIQSLVTDNPKIDPGYIDKLHTLSNPVMKERLLYGNWEYSDDDSSLMDYDSIRAIFSNASIEEGKPFITADIARFGKDNTVIALWNGWRVEKLITLEKSDIQNTADEIRKLMTEHQVPEKHVIADADGLGAGVVDILRCRQFVNNSRPVVTTNTKSGNYANLKTQCYFQLADRINKRGLYVRCNDEKKRALITEELEQVKETDQDTEKKIQILSKDKVKEIIGRSPDYSDCLMMREWFELNPNYGKYRII